MMTTPCSATSTIITTTPFTNHNSMYVFSLFSFHLFFCSLIHSLFLVNMATPSTTTTSTISMHLPPTTTSTCQIQMAPKDMLDISFGLGYVFFSISFIFCSLIHSLFLVNVAIHSHHHHIHHLDTPTTTIIITVTHI